ncbi:hypothetical protein I317_06767 [Kwoniella heveanensis CBS 569]|nr:hypothetical protein I317_06767 [Kwoniella heveanensis CBS 569]
MSEDRHEQALAWEDSPFPDERSQGPGGNQSSRARFDFDLPPRLAESSSDHQQPPSPLSEPHLRQGGHHHQNPDTDNNPSDALHHLGGESGTVKRAATDQLAEDDNRSHPKPRTSSTSSSTNRKDSNSTASAAPAGADTNSRDTGPKRAAQACLRCRKQKLKCIGGWPCNRCTKSKNVCDFGRPGLGPPNREGTTEANARLEQLESSVANLLAGLAGGSAYPNGEMLHTFDPAQRRAEKYPQDAQPYPPQKTGDWAPSLPPPTHVRPIDPPRVGAAPVAPPVNRTTQALSPEGASQPNQVRFISSPNTTFFPGVSPSNISSNGTGPSPASAAMVGSASGPSHSNDISKEGGRSRRKNKGQKAEERLATATAAEFDEAPFKALVYQPAVWDNREQSRRNSPQPSQPQSRDEPPPGTYERRIMRDRDDPVNTDLVDIQMAETLFAFFIDHCHPFLPIVNVALEDAFNTIRQSPFLISAIIAIAARFYIKFTSRSPGAMPPLDASIPSRLANLAEAHLANTLLRKQHALSDVQAVILLSAWGLQSGGRGPDAWVVTGHAARIARRLGLHKVLAQAAEMARLTRPGTPAWDKLEAFLPQWRTWLCWFCFDGFLSLGFGRPQSTQFETVDEQGFLQIRLSQSLPRPGTTPSIALYGDVYMAGQVQLTQIGRDLFNWGEMLADPKSANWADPKYADMFRDKELNVKAMFRDLNARLDEWSKLWVWSGSPYTLYLGSSARIARLQADHMRLCLNSFALKSGPDEDEYVAQCLKKALNAAMSTIQTHYESSQTDMALSFATDYLTITLAQAAVFLVRIVKSAPSVQKVTNIDPSVIAHYLKMSIDLLEAGELSETKLSTYLAKTIRDIARAAEISGLGSVSEEIAETRPPSNRNSEPPQPDPATSAGPDLSMFDIDAFLGFESQLDLNYLLGLPGDNSAILPTVGAGGAQPGNMTPSFISGIGGNSSSGNGGGGGGIGGLGEPATPGFNAEFSFGMNGLGGYGLSSGGGGGGSGGGVWTFGGSASEGDGGGLDGSGPGL